MVLDATARISCRARRPVVHMQQDVVHKRHMLAASAAAHVQMPLQRCLGPAYPIGPSSCQCCIAVQGVNRGGIHMLP